jgi:hypothetical protein
MIFWKTERSYLNIWKTVNIKIDYLSFIFFLHKQTKMMTRSKTVANAVANVNTTTTSNKSIDDDKTVVYPSMFDRWKEPF